MSSFSLAKKLQPAKKAWKRFTKTLYSKLHNLNIHKPIKTTKNYCLLALNSLRRCRLPQKLFRFLPTGRRSSSCRRCYHHLQNGFSAIYADELFLERAHNKLVSSLGKDREEAKEMAASRSGSNIVIIAEAPNTATMAQLNLQADMNLTWKATLSRMPQIRGVDEKAEEFISKFRHEMKLEREQSIIDFEEMLARSV